MGRGVLTLAVALTDGPDDLPLLEYEAPRGLFDGDGQNALRLMAWKLARNAMLPPLPPSLPPPPEAQVWSSIATMYGNPASSSRSRKTTSRP